MSHSHHGQQIIAIFSTLRAASSLIPHTVLAMAALMHPEKTKNIAAITYLSLVPKLIREYWLAAKLRHIPEWRDLA